MIMRSICLDYMLIHAENNGLVYGILCLCSDIRTAFVVGHVAYCDIALMRHGML